jgi:hypothetical protein
VGVAGRVRWHRGTETHTRRWRTGSGSEAQIFYEACFYALVIRSSVHMQCNTQYILQSQNLVIETE